MPKTLEDTLVGLSPYSGYLYAYPHKTAYRRFETPQDFRTVWRTENTGSLFLYMHVPFCEMRCGFCNLFTMTGAKDDAVENYMSAMEREAQAVRSSLPEAKFLEVAIGGGTPTFLNTQQLNRLFRIIEDFTLSDSPISIETSPSRTTPERLKVMNAHNVSRISIGVESFSDINLRAMGRPARTSDAVTALDNIRSYTQASLNLDLIYGAPGQSVADFEFDIRQALRWSPEEVFLYPLYIRPLTGLSKIQDTHKDWDTQRLSQYRAGRALLLDAGYAQYSMRRFLKSPLESNYSCQEDGMIGLGAGARSYTHDIHYSSEYAVGRQAIKSIIDSYSNVTDFSKIRYGIKLSDAEKRRRFAIKSILNADGLDIIRYKKRFGSAVLEDLTELQLLIEQNYLQLTSNRLIPTKLGFERSDAMGPFLISTEIADTMQAYAWS